MRLKTFTASNVAEAMRMVREALGEDAIIVDSQEGDDGGCRVTAAVEQDDADLQAAPQSIIEPDPIQQIHDALDLHLVPPALVERLMTVATSADTDQAVEALALALDALFLFEPLGGRAVPHRPYMLVGPPGSGKTVAIAKMAAQAVLAERDVRVITTDTVRSGAVEQMRAYTELLGIELMVAETPGALREAISACGPTMVLVDSTGVNPFDGEDMAGLRAFLLDGAVEPILTLAAGTNPLDAAETARLFHDLEVRRMIATRIDAARRIGDVLAAADTGELRFSLASDSPAIADPLLRLNPRALARLLLPDTPGTAIHGDRAEAADAAGFDRPKTQSGLGAP